MGTVGRVQLWKLSPAAFIPSNMMVRATPLQESDSDEAPKPKAKAEAKAKAPQRLQTVESPASSPAASPAGQAKRVHAGDEWE